MRSVLSRNLHQHRLWWLAEWRGGVACWPASSSLLASILPSVPSQTTRQPSLSLSDMSWGDEGWGDRLTWDEQYGITRAQKLLRRGGGATLYFFFFFLFSFFLSLYLYFFPKQNGASLPYRSWYWLCVWKWAYVCESEYACWFHQSLFKLFWHLEEDQQND